MLKQWYDWMGQHVRKPYAVPFLAFLFFIEAIFFIPVDPLLILYCVENQKKSFYFSIIATVSSVTGGVLGYIIGSTIWNALGSTLVSYVMSEQSFAAALQYFKTYEIWAVLIAGFTPIPYKAITLAAGFCKLPILPFIVCSFIARGARFFLVASVIYIWGKSVKYYIDRYFNFLVLLFVIITIMAIKLFI